MFSKENGFVPESGLGYTAPGLHRLNMRFQLFMKPYESEFVGKRVLDLASHDGRWSYAALKLGASHVTGIEARPELIEKGAHLFKETKSGSLIRWLRGRESPRFLCGDIFDVMPQLLSQGEKFDVVLCLGIFYHVMDHYRLIRLIRRFEPRLVILDSGLINDEKPYIQLRTERTDAFLNAVTSVGEEEAVVGFVSKGGLELMARSVGFKVEFIEWDPAKIANQVNLHDYFQEGPDKSRRFSATLRRP